MSNVETTGKLMLIRDRASYYFTFIQFLMIFVLFWQQNKMKMYFGVPMDTWLIVGSVSFVLFLLFDYKFLFPTYLNIYTKKNPYMIELLERIKNIEEKLK